MYLTYLVFSIFHLFFNINTFHILFYERKWYHPCEYYYTIIKNNYNYYYYYDYDYDYDCECVHFTLSHRPHQSTTYTDTTAESLTSISPTHICTRIIGNWIPFKVITCLLFLIIIIIIIIRKWILIKYCRNALTRRQSLCFALLCFVTSRTINFVFNYLCIMQKHSVSMRSCCLWLHTNTVHTAKWNHPSNFITIHFGFHIIHNSSCYFTIPHLRNIIDILFKV